VPYAAEVVLLVLLLQDGDDLRSIRQPLHEGIFDGLAEAPAEGEELGRRQALVPEEDDEVLEPGAAERPDRFLAGVPRKIDAGDLGAERARDGMNAERRHRATGSSTTPPPTTDSSPSWLRASCSISTR
jgi:hypothetical protein